VRNVTWGDFRFLSGRPLPYNDAIVGITPVPRESWKLSPRLFPGRDSSPVDIGSPTKSTRAQLSILIVDDVEDTRELYERFMRFQGARVKTAGDGIEALQSVSFERPDVIVLDLAMPRMTGWEAIANLRANPRTRRIPIIALSGQNARDEALAAGADSYLEKPCLPSALLTEVQRVLREPGPRTPPSAR
jgi:two-component system, cell cycle response regulator DivK